MNMIIQQVRIYNMGKQKSTRLVVGDSVLLANVVFEVQKVEFDQAASIACDTDVTLQAYDKSGGFVQTMKVSREFEFDVVEVVAVNAYAEKKAKEEDKVSNEQ